MTTNWRTYKRDTVACRLNRAEIPGLLRKQVVVGPGEAAIVIRDGRVEQVLTEQTTKVADFGDGVRNWDWVKALRGTSPNVEVVFVDLSPLDIPVYLGARAGSQEGASESTHVSREGIQRTESANVAEVILLALSRDKEVITAECHVRCAVHLESAVKVAALLKGREALSVWDLATLVREQILGPVLLPLIAAHDAGEFRASRTLRAEIEEQVRAQIAPALADRGLAFEGFSVAWGLTEAEVEEVERNRARREEEAVGFEHKRALAEMQREQQVERTRLVNLQELAVAEKQGDEELKDLLLLGELRRDLMVEGKRVDLARIEAQIRGIQLDVESRGHGMRLTQQREEQLLQLEIEDRRFKQQQAARLAELDLEDRELSGMVKLQIQMATAKHERELAARRLEIEAAFRTQQAELEHQFQARKLRLEEDRSRMGMTERVLSQAIASGVADPAVLRTLLEQATEQSYATATDDKGRARAEAAAARHNVDAFKEAEDRERRQQQEMTQGVPPFQARIWTQPAAFVTTRDITTVPRRSRSSFRIGDPFTLNAQVEQDCHLTLIDLGTSGNVYLLLVNHLLRSGQAVALSGPDAQREWRIAPPPGIERLKALFTLRPLELFPGMQNFSSLGNAQTTRDLITQFKQAALTLQQMPPDSWVDASCEFVVGV